jgi:hypothetical protein
MIIVGDSGRTSKARVLEKIVSKDQENLDLLPSTEEVLKTPKKP